MVLFFTHGHLPLVQQSTVLEGLSVGLAAPEEHTRYLITFKLVMSSVRFFVLPHLEITRQSVCPELGYLFP